MPIRLIKKLLGREDASRDKRSSVSREPKAKSPSSDKSSGADDGRRRKRRPQSRDKSSEQPAITSRESEEWRPGSGPTTNEPRSDSSRKADSRPSSSRHDTGERRSDSRRETSERRSAPRRSDGERRSDSRGETSERRSAPRRSDGERRSGSQRGRPERQPDAKWDPASFVVPEVEGKTRFQDLDIPDPIMHAIADMKFEYCTPIQAKSLPHSLEGKNVSGRAQTGTGKTAAFLVSILTHMIRKELPPGERRCGVPRALIIAPTRELVIQIAQDAEAFMRYTDYRAVAVYGGMDYEKQQRQLEDGPVDLIAATPGRLLDFKRRRHLDLGSVEIMIIDEADRMLDMGFIPDVRQIISSTPPKSRRQTMLFSATLTPEVLRLASQWMPDPVLVEVGSEKVTVDSIEQVLYAVTLREKFRVLYNMLQREEMTRVLIFGNRRDRTQKLVDDLNRHGVPCELLTGAVAQKKRLSILENFKAGKIKIVVATDVAGRGLHVEGISHVVNYDFPYEPEDYVHRIGRTGRAGAKGVAVSFACENESFIIPDIEEYLGAKLSCIMPPEELLAPPPKPSRPRAREPERERRGGSGSRNSSRGPGRSSRGGRSSGPRRSSPRRP